jgi:DNA-binding Lrp family transcriptional regulator
MNFSVAVNPTRSSVQQPDQLDIALLGAIEDGLPISPTPFAVVARQLQISEEEVISRLSDMQEAGIIRRFGLVLQHRPLGYRANAMVVWDVPDDQVDDVAERIKAHEFVTLCYCRARRAQIWPYNLYCMIHGRQREVVEGQIEELKTSAGLKGFSSKTLFSRRRFKQTGARFSRPSDIERQAS